MRILLSLAALAAASPLQAAWQRAETSHFVIYADEDPVALKSYAEKLERFDAAVRLARAMPDPPVGQGNRLTIYVVPTALDVAKLHRGSNNSVAGFYKTRAIGSVAVVPRHVSKTMQITADSVFFHEYAHHLMFQDMRSPMPSWLVEGFAEFMSTAEVNADGSVGLGAAPVHRARELYGRKNALPFTSMLAGAKTRTAPERSALYARGWLLAHYLTFSKERKGQLENYLTALAAGQAPDRAAASAFGDLRTLEREAEDYLRADKFPYLTLPASALRSANVAVDALSPDAARLMPLAIRLRAGGDEDRAKLHDEIRAAAANSDDPFAQLMLSDAETEARNSAAALAAAERVLAREPQSVDAMIFKGRALLGQGKAAEARTWFNKANRIDPEDPEPLLMFYQSFAIEKKPPTANAIAALHYASDLAPQDMLLRLNSAKAYLAEGNKVKARALLSQVAFNPHAGRYGTEAQALLDGLSR